IAPAIKTSALPTDNSTYFRGVHIVLISADMQARISDAMRIFSEAALSMHAASRAPAAIVGLKHKSGDVRHAFGVFYLDSRFVSLLPSYPRLQTDAGNSRTGAFLMRQWRHGPHLLGLRLYHERNLSSDFTGSSLSHAPPWPRDTFSLLADSRTRLDRNGSLYNKLQADLEPYLINANSDARVTDIQTYSWRGQFDRKQKAALSTFGIRLALEHCAQSSRRNAYGGVIFAQRSMLLRQGLSLYLKLTAFDLSRGLFASRNIYIGTSEPYWQGAHLSSVAYQSLFASYAPRGYRSAAALSARPASGFTAWFKLGRTHLLADHPRTLYDLKFEITLSH
ncbi:MAG: hypothetical protein AABZ44_09080, partial [Elusimicrobiota bacterium]